MLVKDWMSKDLMTVEANDSLLTASNIMRKRNIRLLPVMEKGKLVGVVTDRDVKRASASDARALEIHELLYLVAEIKVREIMSKNPVTIPLDYTVEEAAQILLEKKVSGAPVVDHAGNPIGVITQSDIFRVLVSLTGVKQRGVQFAFQLEDKPGSIKDVTDIMRRYGCRLVSILSTYGYAEEGYRHVYIRACDCDRPRLGALKEELKSKAMLLYVADIREREKEIYEEYRRPRATWVVG
jgi:acetoin utilization protein AcuB